MSSPPWRSRRIWLAVADDAKSLIREEITGTIAHAAGRGASGNVDGLELNFAEDRMGHAAATIEGASNSVAGGAAEEVDVSQLVERARSIRAIDRSDKSNWHSWLGGAQEMKLSDFRSLSGASLVAMPFFLVAEAQAKTQPPRRHNRSMSTRMASTLRRGRSLSARRREPAAGALSGQLSMAMARAIR